MANDSVGKKAVDAVGGVVKGAAKFSSELEKLASQSGRQAEALKDHTGSIEAVSKSLVDIMTTPWQKMSQIIGTNVDTFKELSQTGITFGNSMNNIRMGAADMRMSMGEFSEFMTANQKSFASLGGTVGKGAEEFAKLSKQMVNSELGEKMMQLGYSSKELNEVLAIQIGASKSKLSAEDGSRERAIASAMRMAEEMDELAKLTGKSRKEQEDSRKALQKDMAFEAAMRQETRNMSKEDAEKYRAAMMDLVATTEATQGAAAGAAIKESVITGGSLQSSGAMAHASLNSEAYQKSMEAREKIKQGDYEGAKKTKSESDAAAITSQNSDANLSVARYVGGTAGQVARGTMEATQTQFEGLKALDSSLKDVGGLMAKQKDMIRQEQEARDGHTRAMIQARIEQEKANAAAVSSVGKSMAKGTEFDKSMNRTVDRATDPKTRTTQDGLEKEFDKTFGGISKDIAGAAGKGVEETAKVLTEAAKKIKQVADETVDLIKKFKETLSNPNRAAATPAAATPAAATPAAATPAAATPNRTGPERRAEGGPVKPGEPYWVGEKGPELVVPEQAGNVVSTDKLDKGAGKPANNPGIDLGGQFKDLSTTVSKAQPPAAQADTGKSAALEETKKFADEQLNIVKKGNEKILDDGNSFVLRTGKLQGRQAEMYLEMATLTKEESQAKLDANKKSLEASRIEIKALFDKSDAIQKNAEKEGRALSESEKAQVDALDKEAYAKEDARKQQRNLMFDENQALKKLIQDKTRAESTGLELSIEKNGQIVKLVEGNSAKIAKDMKEAIPVKDLKASTEQVKDVYQKHGESVLGFARMYTDEERATYKEGAETSLKYNIDQLKENNEKLSELQKTANERELTTAEKHRMEELAKENALLESGIKYNQAELEAYKTVEDEKKGIIKKSSEEQVSITQESTQQIRADISDAIPVKELATKQEEFQSQFTESQQKLIDDYKGYSQENRAFHSETLKSGIVEDIETTKKIGDRIAKMKADIGDRQATDEEKAAIEEEEAKKANFEKRISSKKELLDVMDNLEDYSAKRELELKKKSIADENVGPKNQDDQEAIGAAMLANMPSEPKYGDVKEDPTERIKADIKDAIPTSNATQEAIGAAMLANMPQEPKYSDVKEDPTARIKADMQAESINKAKAVKFGDISLDASGMPVVKSKAKEELKKEDPKPPTPSPGKKINPETGEEYTPVGEAPPKKEAAKEQKSNLDDVVKKLELLNTTVNTLIKKTEEASASQVRATKSMASGNLFGAR